MAINQEKWEESVNWLISDLLKRVKELEEKDEHKDNQEG